MRRNNNKSASYYIDLAIEYVWSGIVLLSGIALMLLLLVGIYFLLRLLFQG